MQSIRTSPARSALAQLESAHELLRAGRFDEAEAVCRRLLGAEPRDPGATHLLGLIRKDVGDAAEGERLIRASIALAPARAEFRANLGNLLRRLGRLADAVRCYREALGLEPDNRSARLGLTRTLNDLGDSATAEGEARVLVSTDPRDPQAWSALAMTLRDQNRVAEAESAYEQAISVAPDHAAAHHNLGALYVSMNRADRALAALDRARTLGAKGFEIEFNRGRALVGLYLVEEAEEAFARAVAIQPRHLEAQLNLARLRFMRGDPSFARSLSQAAAAHADDLDLSLLLARVVWRGGDVPGAEALLRDLRKRRGESPEIGSALASVLHESGRLHEAEHEALEAAAARPNDPILVENLVAILLARGRAEDAMQFVRTWRTREPGTPRWVAYEATAARLLGQPLYQELCDYRQFVRTYELEPPSGWASMEALNAALADALAARHRFVTHPLDQSLRNGSQSAGSMLTDVDPAIRALFVAFEGPLDDYQKAIGKSAGHPLSSRNTGAAAITGAWSVQLRREGYHVNHIHPEGWISSAYYVAVPAEVNDATLMSGWIKFGEPRMPVPGVKPECFIKPQPGRLVLFPSYMWHGTNPIHGVEPRTTIAFDAVPTPRQH